MFDLGLWLRSLLEFSAGGLVSYIAYRANALTGSGAVAASLVGGSIVVLGGEGWAVLLVLFFVSSSALSLFKARDTRKSVAAETFDKGGRRDAAQVLANGVVAAVLASLYGLASSGRFEPPSYGYALLLPAAYAGALAAATADTWATEIGVLSKATPRMITTGRRADAGTSGAITWVGSGAAIAGALFIGVAGAALTAFMLLGGNQPFLLLVSALVGGVAGSMFDSLLGATVQASYWCPHCAKVTESRVHRCGTRTQLKRGIGVVSNDLVNLLATILGAVVAGAIHTVGGL